MRADIHLIIAGEGRSDLRGRFRFHVVDPANLVQLGDIQVTALCNIHPPFGGYVCAVVKNGLLTYRV